MAKLNVKLKLFVNETPQGSHLSKQETKLNDLLFSAFLFWRIKGSLQ